MSTVSAQVILYLPDGSSPLDRPPSDESTTPSQDAFQQSRKMLQQLGFTVGDSGALGWTINADVKLFEEAFNATLEYVDGEWTMQGEIAVNEALKPWVNKVLLTKKPEWY